MPQEGRLLYTKTEISGYSSVLDHYETRSRDVTKTKAVGTETYTVGYRDLGNGYYEEITDTRTIYETYTETENLLNKQKGPIKGPICLQKHNKMKKEQRAEWQRDYCEWENFDKEAEMENMMKTLRKICFEMQTAAMLAGFNTK